MEEDTEWKNLPIDEKCTHKSWKARLDGYEAAGRLFQSIDDDKSPEWSKYAGLLKKFIADSNLTAQERGLDAVLAYIENYVHAGRTVGEVMSNMVQKCIGSACKPKTKELAVQIALMYIEIERHEVVIEELLKGTESKNPKTSCGCLMILTQALREFGPKVVGVSKMLKKMPTTLSDRDKNVRGEARSLVVEIYRWIGSPIKQQLSSLKPVQMTELETEFDKISGSPPTPTRLLRSQQAKKATQVLAGDTTDSCDTEIADKAEGEHEIDPTEFLEPVDVLAKLPKNFFTQLEEKKWTERRDALELLEKELSSAPRLEPVDYGDLIRALKKIVAKDSNIVVVAIGIKCLTGLANGLKKKFTPYVGAVMPTLLEKFKEKKQNVVIALRESVDAVFLVSHLESISEDIVAALDNKNPCIKNEVSLFLARCFTRCTTTILNKKLLKVLSASLLKVLNDSDPGARDASASALGTAMKVVGEKGIAPFLADIGEQRMSKIKSCCETAELQKPIRVASSEVKSDKAAKSVSGGKPVSRPTSKTNRPVKKEAPGKIATVRPSSQESSSGELAKKLSSKIPADILNELNNSDGNKRLQAFDELHKHIQKTEVTKDSVMAFFEILGSLDDDSVGLVEVKINCLMQVAGKCDLSGIDLKPILLSLLKKYNDPKFAECVAGCLASFARSLGCDQFAQSILSPGIVSDRSLWAASLKWIAEVIINHNLNFGEDYLQREAQKAINSGSLIVRNAGFALVGTLHTMDKGSAESSPPPVARPTKTETKKREVKSSDGSPSKNTVDVTTIFTAVVVTELNDETWKTRYECLEKLKPLLEASGPINHNIGEVQNIFETLLTDKNTKVVQSCLACLALLMRAIGPQCRKYTNFFMPKVLKNISDPKVWVRNSVINVIEVLGSVGSYKEIFDNDTLADVCKTITLPAAKVELYTWITNTLNRVDTVPNDGLVAMLPNLYQSLEDRNGDIRKISNEAMISFMMHLGYDCMANASSNLKGSTATLVKGILDKNRGSVPEPVEPTYKSKLGGPQSKLKMGPGSSATFTKPSKGAKSNIPNRPASSKKEEQEVSEGGPLLEINHFKHQRIMDEQKLKTLKWNFTTPRAEFIELLKDQMNSANFNPTLVSSMFHPDFKFHNKAIDTLAEDLHNNRGGLIANLDLILRWMTLRFFDTNPSVLIKGLEYLLNVFNTLIEEHYNMFESEAISFLPYLILKVGDPKDTVKNNVRNIFKLTALLYPRQKLFAILLEGLKSKNARQRAELLELLCWMISTYSLDVCFPSNTNALKEIAKHIADKDTSVRNGALNCMVAGFYLVGEDIYKHIGPLPYGPNSLLEERLKRALKNRPIASIKPMESPPQDRTFRKESPRVVQQQQEEDTSIPEDMDDSDEINTSDRNNSTYSSSETTSQNQSPQQAISPPHHSPQQSTRWDMTKLIEMNNSLDPMYRLDTVFFEPLTSLAMPELIKIDLSFLDEPPIVRPRSKFSLPSSSSSIASAQPSCSSSHLEDPAIKELTNPDLEKALTAMAKIETLLYSDKAQMLNTKMDFLVQQLEQQLLILNQSTHPDLVNCYRGNFSLILKISDNKKLCQEITEVNLSKLIKQLLLLLTEHRLEKIGQEMFVKTVNNVVIRLLETSNKTAVVSGLIKMLHSTVRPPSSKRFQDLVSKCLWKLNRAQSVWDSELIYPTILSDINAFLTEHPTSWWKTQEAEIPLRTVKTILHTMVKIRGNRVKEELDLVPGLLPDSEISCYIRKVIRHFKLDNAAQQSNNNNALTANTNTATTATSDVSTHNRANTPENEITDILKPFVNSQESPDALKRLYDFKKCHPTFDLDSYLIRLPTPAICYIKRGLVNLDMNSNESLHTITQQNQHLDNPRSTDPEVEFLWKRLDYWKQQINDHKNKEN